MRVVELKVQNFRGIRSAHWQPAGQLCCVIGAGDTGKSTLLEAVDVVLSPRSSAFAATDFHNADTTQAIQVEATVGALPKAALADSRFGLQLRGWSQDGQLHDEPEDADDPVVTVRLTVDSSMEGTWELVNDRGAPRGLSNRDRALFGVHRLGGDSDRVLTWGYGTALSRAEGGDQVGALMAAAFTAARQHVGTTPQPALQCVAQAVYDKARSLGAYAPDPFQPGLDTNRDRMTVGTLALHSDDLPVRLAGLGTRRLTGLAVQLQSVPDGAIVLVDEIEVGLEPHRIRRALAELRRGTGQGQVLLTTHSPVAVAELGVEHLVVARKQRDHLVLKKPAAELQPLFRRAPDAPLARSLLVCEGKTEVGLLRAFREGWRQTHGEPLESLGAAIVNGEGSNGPQTTLAFAALGYRVCFLRDSDVVLAASDRDALMAAGAPVIEWSGGVATEERLAADLTAAGFQQMVDLAIQEHGTDSVLQCTSNQSAGGSFLGKDTSTWQTVDGSPARAAFARAAKKKEWFKNITAGERLGEIVAAEFAAGTLGQPSTEALRAIEEWVYGDAE